MILGYNNINFKSKHKNGSKRPRSFLMKLHGSPTAGNCIVLMSGVYAINLDDDE